MERENHTPGPWTVGASGQSVHASDGKAIAREVGPYIRGGGAPHGERAANARLIAAAPELLEAAQQAVWIVEATHGAPAVTEALRAAIAKATDQS